MPKGIRKTLGKFICKSCKENFTSMANHPKYCKNCRTHRPWEVWSLDYTRRMSSLLNGARNRAKDKNLFFDLDKEYLISLWDENEGKCALTGIKFDLEQWGNKGQVNPNAPSLDRIVPSLGYIKGNVRLITYHMNVALSEYGTMQFENLAKSFLINGIAA